MAVDDEKTTDDMGVEDGNAGVSVADDAGAAGDGPVGEDRVGEGGVDLDDDSIVESDAPADELIDYHENEGHNAVVDFIDSTKGKVIMGTAAAVVLLGGFFAINHFGEGDAPEEGAGEIAAPASLSPDQIADRGAMSGRETGTERSSLNTTTSRSADVTTPSSSPRGVAEGRSEARPNREPTSTREPSSNPEPATSGGSRGASDGRNEPQPQPRPQQQSQPQPAPQPQQPTPTPAPTQQSQQQPQQQPQPAPSVTTVYQTPDRDR